MLRPGAVEPGGRGWIIDPGMVRAGVIHHLVLNDLDAGAMRSLNQLAQLRVRAEVFLDAVKVLRVVAMKSGARFVFLQLDLVEAIVVVVPRREPDSGDAEVL